MTSNTAPTFIALGDGIVTTDFGASLKNANSGRFVTF